MRITMWEDKTRPELEVEIIYPEWNREAELVKSRLTGLGETLAGEENGRRYSINVFDIYYIESVERKTFIYTKEGVYRTELKLYEVAERLPESDFERVSKSCILNLNVLESIAALPNSKLEALLDNGEKVIVSRTYLVALRKKLEGGDSYVDERN